MFGSAMDSFEVKDKPPRLEISSGLIASNYLLVIFTNGSYNMGGNAHRRYQKRIKSNQFVRANHTSSSQLHSSYRGNALAEFNPITEITISPADSRVITIRAVACVLLALELAAMSM